MKPGKKFDVAVSVLDAPNSKPRFLSTKPLLPTMTSMLLICLLSFLPRDNTLRGVLLSQDEEVAYRIDCRKVPLLGLRPHLITAE